MKENQRVDSNDNLENYNLLLSSDNLLKVYEKIFALKDNKSALGSALKTSNSEGQNLMMLLLKNNMFDEFLKIWPYIDSCRNTPQILGMLDKDGRSILFYIANSKNNDIMQNLLKSMKSHISANIVTQMYFGSPSKPNNLMLYLANLIGKNHSNSHVTTFQMLIECYREFFGDNSIGDLLFKSDKKSIFFLIIEKRIYSLCQYLFDLIFKMMEKNEINDLLINNLYEQKNQDGYTIMMILLLHHYSDQSDKTALLLYNKMLKQAEKYEDIMASIINTSDINGNNIFMMLIVFSMTEIFTQTLQQIKNNQTLELLLSYKNKRGDDILMLVIRHRNHKIFQIILNLMVKICTEEKILHYLNEEKFDLAVSTNSDSIILEITKYVQFDKKNNSGRKKIAKFLNSRDKNGCTPLIRAINNDDQNSFNNIIKMADETSKLQKILLLSSTDNQGFNSIILARQNKKFLQKIDNFATSNDISFYVQSNLKKQKQNEDYKKFISKIKG